MKISIQSQGFEVTGAMSELIEGKLFSALGRHRARVVSVDVRLGDENGPRGGIDKYCRIQVYLQDARTARAADLRADLYDAIECASHKVSRVVAKHIDRAAEIGRGAADVYLSSTHAAQELVRPEPRRAA